MYRTSPQDDSVPKHVESYVKDALSLLTDPQTSPRMIRLSVTLLSHAVQSGWVSRNRCEQVIIKSPAVQKLERDVLEELLSVHFCSETKLPGS